MGFRRARVEDHEAIAAFTRDTFEWGDYVAEAFPSWLEDPDTAVFVATGGDDVAVGLARTEMVSPLEGWLASARVHPEHRRRGLATGMNDLCMEWLRQRGALVARLAVEAWNEAARLQVLRLGFRPICEWTSAVHELEATGSPHRPNGGTWSEGELAPADPADAEPAFGSWTMSELARAAHGLISRDWTWRTMTLEDVMDASQANEFLGGPDGWAIAGMEGEEPRARLSVRWLSASPESAGRLVSTLSRYGNRRRLGVAFKLPTLPQLDGAVEQLGYEVDHLTVFEKETVTASG